METNNKFWPRIHPWLLVVICASFLLYKYILQVSPSVMVDELMSMFQLTGSGLGNLAAMFFYSYMITQLFVGPLLDRYSCRWFCAAAILLSSLGALLFSYASVLEVALLARALMGIGVAFATVGYLKLTAVWFPPERYATMTGFLASAAMLGSIIGQAPLAMLVTNYGWQHAMVICAFIGFGLTILFFLIVRDRNPASILTTHVIHSDKPTWQDYKKVFTKKENWLLMMYSGLAFAPLAVFGGLWGNPFLQQAYHVSRTQAASITSMMFLGLAFGGPVLGIVADKVGRVYPVMIVGILVAFFSLSAVIYAPEPEWLTGVMLFIFGFGTGAFMLGFALGKEINDIAMAATVIGMINTGDALFGALTEPTVGKILDALWDGSMTNGIRNFNLHEYHSALALLPIYLLFAFMFLVVLAITDKNVQRG